MIGFEPWTSGVGIDSSANWATITFFLYLNVNMSLTFELNSLSSANVGFYLIFSWIKLSILSISISLVTLFADFGLADELKRSKALHLIHSFHITLTIGEESLYG